VTELVLKAIGPAAVGVNAAFYYSSQLDNAANKDFITTMKKADPSFVPSHFTAGAWATGSVLIDTIQRLKGNVGNGATFAKAIRQTRIQAPWGRLTFDPKTGYGRGPTYFYKVVDNEGVLQHQILAKLAG
jgi:branched-chain amino acid transport system substrate-binding protein